eukprot:snap_masked-scaffold_7-processed-gene-6.20-mRNA-1 protein AED:1.00 eAED:1.00 QI:0/-1/0/0/-1/1/1/0/240
MGENKELNKLEAQVEAENAIDEPVLPYKLPFKQAVTAYKIQAPKLFWFLILGLFFGTLSSILHLVFLKDSISGSVSSISNTNSALSVSNQMNQLVVQTEQGMFGNTKLMTKQDTIVELTFTFDDLNTYRIPAGVVLLWQLGLNIAQLGNKFDMCYFLANLARIITFAFGVIFIFETIEDLRTDLEFIESAIGNLETKIEIEDTEYMLSGIFAAVAMLISLAQIIQYCCFSVNKKRWCTCQ